MAFRAARCGVAARIPALHVPGATGETDGAPVQCTGAPSAVPDPAARTIVATAERATGGAVRRRLQASGHAVQLRREGRQLGGVLSEQRREPPRHRRRGSPIRTDVDRKRFARDLEALDGVATCEPPGAGRLARAGAGISARKRGYRQA